MTVTGVTHPPPRFVLTSVSSRSSPGGLGCPVGSEVQSWVFLVTLIYFSSHFLDSVVCQLEWLRDYGPLDPSPVTAQIRWSRSHLLLIVRLLGPPVALLHIFIVPTKMCSFLLPFKLSCCCFPRYKTANLVAAVWLRVVRSSQPAGFGV